jgi:hypothetical protein
MRVPQKTAVALSVLVLGGCAWQSEALKIGQDTYQTSARASPARGGEAGAREMALTTANKKCESMGREIEVTNTDVQWAFPAATTVTATFKCK